MFTRKAESTDALIRSNYSDQIDEGKMNFYPQNFNVSVNNDWDDLPVESAWGRENKFYQFDCLGELNFHDLRSASSRHLPRIPFANNINSSMCCVNLEIDLFISSLWCLCTPSSFARWWWRQSRMCYSQREALVIADNLSFVI